jgi:serine/threonine protein kinase
VYCPVAIGNRFKGERYTVKHKLGWGGYSTIWIAWDVVKKTNVALKVLVDGKTECSVHESIAKVLHETIAQVECSRLLLSTDTFKVSFQGRSHEIVVLPLCGPNLATYSIKRTTSMQQKIIVAKELLKAVRNLHAGGFVHRGTSVHGRFIAPIFLLHPADIHDRRS